MGLKQECAWEMGSSAEHMVHWAGGWCPRIQEPPVSPGQRSLCLLSNCLRVLERGSRWAEAAEHGHRSEGGSHRGSGVPGWGLCWLIFHQLQGAQGTSMPHWAQGPPRHPSLPRGQGVICTSGERGRLMQVRVKEALFADDNHGLCLPKGSQVA